MCLVVRVKVGGNSRAVRVRERERETRERREDGQKRLREGKADSKRESLLSDGNDLPAFVGKVASSLKSPPTHVMT